MRSKYYLGLVAAGLSIAGLAACGDDVNQGAGGSGTGGNTTSSTTGSPTTNTSTTTTGTSTSTGAGGMSDGNDSFEEAQDLPINETGGSDGPKSDLGFTGDSDYYKFTGKKGQALFFFVRAQEIDMATFDPSYIDTVITLYDANKTQIANDDDPIPQTQNDSQLTTVLPADGEYYLRITECWSVSDMCAPTADKTNTSYELYAFNLDPAQPGTVKDTEKGNTEAGADPVTYAPNPDAMSTGYYATTIFGDFASATDVDVFSFTVPADINVTAGRPSAYVEASVTGVDANGSSTPQGLIWITEATAPTVKLGQIDGTHVDPREGYTLSPPIDFTKNYFIWIQHPVGGTPGNNPFYVLNHYNAGSNDPEKELAGANTNDTIAGAETMTSGATQGGGTANFVAGDLGATDLADIFSFDVTGVAGDKMFATCAGLRIGSGLRGLKLSVLKADGTSVATGTETADANANLGDGGVDFPTTEGTLYLKVEKATQDPEVTGTYYQCAAGFITPM